MATPSQFVNQSRVTISGGPIEMPGTWQTKSGGNVSREVFREKEGGELFKEDVSVGPPTYDDITVSRSYKRDRDASIRRFVESGRSGLFTLSEQPLDESGLPSGEPFVYNVRLISGSVPETDANGTDRQRIELSFAREGEVA